jgi:hypothetical protein
MDNQMKECAVSMVGQDGRTYDTAVEATSLFDAAARALEQWARLWWYRSKAMLESPDGARQRVAPGRRSKEWRCNRTYGSS